MRNGPIHILLVDDDEVTNFLSQEMLKLFLDKPVIHITSNGQEAIDYLQARSGDSGQLPDIILLDINMPIMDGWDFLAELEKIRKPGFERVKIYMFTSSVYYEDIDRAKTYATVQDIFSKPLDEEKIRAITHF